MALETRSYLAWSSAESSHLLPIEGKPGSGKSTLMKFFHRSLLGREPRERQIVASFYYSYREANQSFQYAAVGTLRTVSSTRMMSFSSTFSPITGKLPKVGDILNGLLSL